MIKILIALIFVAGCTSQSNKINVNRMKEDEKIYIGKFKVFFNDQGPSTSNCELFINSEFRPALKISENGYVFYKSKAPIIKFNQIACWDHVNSIESKWYNYDLPLTRITPPNSTKVITYFGDITIKWNTNAKSKKKPVKSMMTKSLSENTFEEIERIYNAGQMKVEITNNLNQTAKIFLKENPDAKNDFKFQGKILDID